LSGAELDREAIALAVASPERDVAANASGRLGDTQPDATIAPGKITTLPCSFIAWNIGDALTWAEVASD
jgi:hypothetical protein